MKTTLKSWDLPRKPGRAGPRNPRERGYVLLCVVLWCVLTSVTANRFVYSSFYVLGPSMQPTLKEGDWRLVNRWRHRLADFQRGDLALLCEPGTETKVVKRIIGLPGDVLEIRRDAVYVNRRRLIEPYVPRNAYTWSRKMGTRPLILADNQYFVMGDNRLNSLDSRWYGPVTRADLLGIVEQ